jgi:hypothetical protein
MPMTPEELQAKRKERARRWSAAGTLRGYPALAAEDETEETLAAEPPARAEKKSKPNDGPQDWPAD